MYMYRVQLDTLLFVVDAQIDIRWAMMVHHYFFTSGVFIFLHSKIIVFDAGCAVNYSQLQLEASNPKMSGRRKSCV